jgi:CheY-like chemotaxis protein
LISREEQVDAAFALGQLPSVVGVYALKPIYMAPTMLHPDALVLAVMLRPYSIKLLVEAHYKLLANTSGEVTGRVLYVNADTPHKPAPLTDGKLITLNDPERAAAAIRAKENAANWARIVRMEEEKAAALEAEMLKRNVLTNLDSPPIAIALESGVFEVLPDPFALSAASAELVKKPRVLVADVDSKEADKLRQSLAVHGVDVAHASDGWWALEVLLKEKIDLALCALKLDADFTGLRIYRMVAKQRPEMAARIVFMTSADALSQAPPSSALGRVLPRPVSPLAVMAMIEQWSSSTT